jgi:hypothetical protein
VVHASRVVDMEFGGLFWWNFWVVVQVLIVVGIVIALALFIRWGRRKSAILERTGSPKAPTPSERD